MKEGSSTAVGGGAVNAGGKMLTEQEVYTQVAKLFGQDEDLLREFGQFLPDATNHQSGSSSAAAAAAAAAQYMSKSAAAALHNDHHQKGQVQTQARSGGTTATLSGGAHISMSTGSTALPNSGSPLQLSSGATLSQIDAHAAAIGNLSAVNTSVSIKSAYSSNNSTSGNNNLPQNHILSSAVYEKDYHSLSQQQLQQQQQRNNSGVYQPVTTGLRASVAMLGTGIEQRNNHHAQKYITQQQQPHLSQKKSPSYVATLSHHHAQQQQPAASVAVAAQHQHHHHPQQQQSHHLADQHQLEQRNSPNYITTVSAVPQLHPNTASRRPPTEELNLPVYGGSNLTATGPPPAKRPKPYCRDVSFSEASCKCTISDAAFFDKVRKALRNPEVYHNFLRCLTLFNQEIVSKTELLGLVSPFLTKFPDLLRWFTDFLGPPAVAGQIGSGGVLIDGIPLAATQRQGGGNSSSSGHDRVSSHQNTNDYVQDVDLSLCKRLGASYCALPQSTVPKKCSGRDALCREVLNDKWVSFPTWASEDSTFVTSRKTQFEETIYRNIHRTEDERFELDLVIEVNSATIRVLENVQKKMSRMSPEELVKYHLDDHLGGTSQTIHQRAIHRIYGDKSGEIIQGMKKNPSVAVPIVLKRLKVKEEEWRDAQKGFNKQWREQNEKYYLKSLDHQAINFKPNDMKALRSKNLFNEIETLYDERHDQDDDGMEAAGPHLILPYKDKTILDDAANLLIHHVKRQTGIQKQEKQKIKQIIRQFVPDLFFAPRQPLSDDERDDDDTKMDVDLPVSSNRPAKGAIPSESASPARSSGSTSSSGGVGGISAAIKKETEDSASKATSATTITAAAPIGTTTKVTDATPTTSTAAVAAAVTVPEKDETLQVDNTVTTVATTLATMTTTTTTAASGTSPKRAEEASSAATTASSSNDLSVKQEQLGDFPSPKLLPPHAQGQREDESYSLFFANNNWYLFLRLHAILCERLNVMYERARLLAIEEERCRVNRRESTATALRLKPKPDVQVEDYYPTFLDMLKNVLDGNMDSNTFEDTMREMFGIYAYISFTLDKVVSNAVRQLQYCVTERAALDCVELYGVEQRRGSTGGNCRDAPKSFDREMSYQRKAESMLNEENCFKVFIYKIDCRVTIELLDSEPEEVEKPVLKAQKFNKYVERLANPSFTGIGNDNVVTTSDIKTEQEEENPELGRVARKARFLLRNKRQSQLHEEQVRQLFEQKRHCGEVTASTAAASTVSSNDVPTTNNNNNNNWNKRTPERLGAPQLGLAEQYAFNDRDEISTNASNGRCFVTSKNLKLLKYDAVRRAKKSHCRVTQLKYNRFQAYCNKWLQQHVSEPLQQHCQDWLLGKTPEQINASGWGATSKTKLLLQKDTTKTPYRIYTRYKVQQSNALNTTTATATSSATTAALITTVAPAATASIIATPAAASVAATATVVPVSSNNLLTTADCNSAVAVVAVTANNATEATLQQVRPMES
ncbi:paired amphipathic helix protein Sin3a isoform X3 [Drosophila busckii]|nr:paired amphipathic helix protein Sin3a isoform X3 [Drosophila busckii]